jgi:hypothetical protein
MQWQGTSIVLYMNHVQKDMLEFSSFTLAHGNSLEVIKVILSTDALHTTHAVSRMIITGCIRRWEAKSLYDTASGSKHNPT